MKEGICTAVGVVGSAIAAAFGGWDQALVTLVIFMVIDYLSGLIVAGIFHNSRKTENGALESRAGWKGLCRKGVTLLFVLIAYRLDLEQKIWKNNYYDYTRYESGSECR